MTSGSEETRIDQAYANDQSMGLEAAAKVISSLVGRGYVVQCKGDVEPSTNEGA